MEKLDWSNVDTWLKDLRACKGGKEWVQEKMNELLGIKESGETSIFAYIYALEQMMLEEKRYTWALWFITRILEKDECDKFISFALTQIPNEFDKDNKTIIDFIEKSKSYMNDLMIEKGVMSILQTCYLINPSGNKNVVFATILNYGIDLLKQRKGNK